MNNETLTSGMFYCRESAKMKGCGLLQTSSWLDSDVLRNRQQKHTAIRCNQWQKFGIEEIKSLADSQKNADKLTKSLIENVFHDFGFTSF